LHRPTDQVGEHHCRRAGGCRAYGDSRGIRAGTTDGVGNLGGVTAQPLASSTDVKQHQFFFLHALFPSPLAAHLRSSVHLAELTVADHIGQAVATVPLSRMLAGLGLGSTQRAASNAENNGAYSRPMNKGMIGAA